MKCRTKRILKSKHHKTGNFPNILGEDRGEGKTEQAEVEHSDSDHSLDIIEECNS